MNKCNNKRDDKCNDKRYRIVKDVIQDGGIYVPFLVKDFSNPMILSRPIVNYSYNIPDVKNIVSYDKKTHDATIFLLPQPSKSDVEKQESLKLTNDKLVVYNNLYNEILVNYDYKNYSQLLDIYSKKYSNILPAFMFFNIYNLVYAQKNNIKNISIPGNKVSLVLNDLYGTNNRMLFPGVETQNYSVKLFNNSYGLQSNPENIYEMLNEIKQRRYMDNQNYNKSLVYNRQFMM